MDADLHEHLTECTDRLRKLVAASSTEAVTTKAAYYVRLYDLDKRGQNDLSSPAKQILFLLGLMLTTDEPAEPTQFDEEEWQASVELLDDIISTYALMFWPTDQERSGITRKWLDTRQVAMSAFLHYLSAGDVTPIAQLEENIEKYLCCFDEDLKSLMGISASDALAVARWVTQSLIDSESEVRDAAKAEAKCKDALLKHMRHEQWDVEQLRHKVEEGKHVTCTDYAESIANLKKALDDLFAISTARLVDKFGAEIASAYIYSFAASRGEFTDFTYSTDENLAARKPLFKVDGGRLICPSLHQLYVAVLRVGEGKLLKSTKRLSFLRRRDHALEGEVERQFRSLFGDTARYFRGVYERQELSHEHDLIITSGRRVLLIEAKASPPTEPFRDPERSFVRIKRAFRAKTGIQGAFDQANRIRKKIIVGQAVPLFDQERRLVCELKPEETDELYCICVTRDDFGPLSADLSILLKKSEADPYPWAVSALDLQKIFYSWEHFGWSTERFFEFLDERVRLHGIIGPCEELVVAGYYLQHGTYRDLFRHKVDTTFLVDEYSNIFFDLDKSRETGERITLAQSEPAMAFLGSPPKDTVQGEPIENQNDKSPKRQGRNELCACGSGLKYKRCCGRRW